MGLARLLNKLTGSQHRCFKIKKVTKTTGAQYAEHACSNRHRRRAGCDLALRRQSGCITSVRTWFSVGNIDRQYRRIIFNGCVNRRVRAYVASLRNLAIVPGDRFSRRIHHFFHIFSGYCLALRTWRIIDCRIIRNGFCCTFNRRIIWRLGVNTEFCTIVI